MGRKLRITGLAMIVIVFLVLSACGTGKKATPIKVVETQKYRLGKKILSWPMLHGYLLLPVTT